MTRYLTLEWIVAYHEVLMYEQGQLPHLIAPDKLEAALARPQASAFGEDAFATLAEKAAALLQAVVIAHPFLDGNKRAGLGALLSFLELNGETAVADQDALYDFVIAVTTGQLREIEVIARNIRQLFGVNH